MANSVSIGVPMLTRTHHGINYTLPTLLSHYQKDCMVLAVQDFGFLVGINETVTWSQLCDRIDSHCQNDKAQYLTSLVRGVVEPNKKTV